MEVKTSSPTVSVEDLKIDTTTTTSSTASSVYHIYHTGKGKRPKNYSLHSLRDSETTILSTPKPPKASKKQRKSKSTALVTTDSKAVSQIQSTEIQGQDGAPLELTPSVPLKGFKKFVRYDNPKCDPRTENAPYFVSLPLLAGHDPPYTLRRGGHKKAQVACLLHGSLIWRKWDLEFGDMLQQDGVIDGRGVINAKYGTKDGKDGYFKGYKVAKRRWWGETGKQYFNDQKALGFPDNVDAGKEKMKPEEVVKLVWNSPFSLRMRHHSFTWRGFEFTWKGTKQVESRNAAKPFVWCNHLKLIVLVPDNGAKKEMYLAKYTCVMGHRKAGRLEIDQEVVDEFLEGYVLKDEKESAGGSENCENEVAEAEAAGSAEAAKTQLRFRDIMVGTSLCMIMTEREKRRFVLELIQTVAENAG